jgi:uncharacterized RDD family membrane protein YckC
VSTPPHDRPQDQPSPYPGGQYPGTPGTQYPGAEQPGGYPGQPGGQYSGGSQYPGAQYPAQPGPSSYPGQSPYQGQPGQLAHPAQPGQYGQRGAAPGYNPSQPGYNPYGGGGGLGYTYAPPGQLAGWGSRAGASIIDSLLAVIPLGIALIAAIAISGGTEQLSDASGVVLAIGYLSIIGLQVWNRVIRQGRTGQSLGKKAVGLKVVNVDTGQLLGVGRTFARELCGAIFNYLCFLNLLWPLWDDKHQTWHDKVASDIVIKL